MIQMIMMIVVGQNKKPRPDDYVDMMMTMINMTMTLMAKTMANIKMMVSKD